MVVDGGSGGGDPVGVQPTRPGGNIFKAFSK